MNFKKISIMLMLSLTVWAQSATPAAGGPKTGMKPRFIITWG